MRFTSPVRRKHARIEIIPLIDIMFFLLASFMLVSLNMTKVENIQVNLPGASQVQEQFGADIIYIAVDKSGGIWVEKNKVTLPELYTVLTNRYQRNERFPVLIGGDADTHHGDMVAVLEFVRRAGIQRVSFTATAEQTPSAPAPKS
jgi:biopolymer transport protein ExbD